MDVYIYISLLIDNKFELEILYIVYDAQDQRGESSPNLLALILFEFFCNAEDQNNEFNNVEQKFVRFYLLES